MAAVTLQELINHVGVVDKALDERCSDEHINKISQYLPWKLVAPHLLLTETDIDDIDRDGKGENDKRWKALLTWKERQAFKATYKMLIEGLLTTGRATCAESVCSLLKGVHCGLAPERNPVQPHSDNSSSGFSSNGSDKEDSAISAQSAQFSGSPTLLPACNCGKCSVYSSLSMPCLHPHPHDVVPVWNDDETKDDSGQLTKYRQFEYKCELEKHTDVIARRFIRLQRATCQSFKRCNVSPQGILLYLKSLRTFRPVRTCTQSLLVQRLSELGRAQNMKEIFEVLSDYWSWYNYTLLEDLIQKFGTNQDKERLDEFKDELDEFLNFRAKKPESMTFGEGDENSCHVLLVKVDKNWDDIPLHQVDSVHNTVADILGLEKRALFLCSVCRGCILLRFLVPPCVPKLAFPLKPSQKEALETAGVMQLKCERHRYEFPSTHYSQSAQADDSTDIHITEQESDLDEGSGNSSGVEADFSDTSVIQNDTKCNKTEDDEVAAHNSTAVDLTSHKKGKLQTLRTHFNTEFGDKNTESDSGGGVEFQRNHQRHRGHLLYLLMGLFGLFTLLLLLGCALWIPGGSTITQPRDLWRRKQQLKIDFSRDDPDLNTIECRTSDSSLINDTIFWRRYDGPEPVLNNQAAKNYVYQLSPSNERGSTIAQPRYLWRQEQQPRTRFIRIVPDQDTIRLTYRTDGGSPINAVIFRRDNECEGDSDCVLELLHSKMLRARTLPTVSNKVTAVQLCRVAEIPCNYSIEWVRVHPTFRHRLKWEHARRTFIVLTPEIQNVPSPHRMITDTETRPIPIENPEESSNLVLPVDDTCRSIRGRVYYCPNQPIEYYKILVVPHLIIRANPEVASEGGSIYMTLKFQGESYPHPRLSDYALYLHKPGLTLVSLPAVNEWIHQSSFQGLYFPNNTAQSDYVDVNVTDLPIRNPIMHENATTQVYILDPQHLSSSEILTTTFTPGPTTNNNPLEIDPSEKENILAIIGAFVVIVLIVVGIPGLAYCIRYKYKSRQRKPTSRPHKSEDVAHQELRTLQLNRQNGIPYDDGSVELMNTSDYKQEYVY